MNLRFSALSGLFLIAIAVSFLPPAELEAQSSSQGSYTIDGIPDTGQYVPGDYVLARVEESEITADEFVERYFSSLIQFRPAATLGMLETARLATYSPA